jgi:predicted transcriptional regulator
MVLLRKLARLFRGKLTSVNSNKWRLCLTFDRSGETPWDKRAIKKANLDMVPLKPERRAQLEEYAKRRGQDPAAALDDALATYLEWERQDFSEAVARIGKGYEDVRAGRTRPSAEFLADLRVKHDLPR